MAHADERAIVVKSDNLSELLILKQKNQELEAELATLHLSFEAERSKKNIINSVSKNNEKNCREAFEEINSLKNKASSMETLIAFKRNSIEGGDGDYQDLKMIQEKLALVRRDIHGAKRKYEICNK
ncbi:hypothetical protein [Chromobacterium sp. IIBBL 290-4]|uniref:hypothetical protein n=1 Tax=Chromobacterium sp. IIBBL 290-4 TaxID=2953890 RepID=UPI0020B8C7C3|nr:hypothetical protein [Chromobacterium sp. IIBBL 290-4]UTH75000.1 hypothetical protein NKT35_02520 [Chromobacterium sp. IIBBL 290-4]